MKHCLIIFFLCVASPAATQKCIWTTNTDGSISAQNGNIVVSPVGGISGASHTGSSDFLGIDYHMDLGHPSAGNIEAVITDSDDFLYTTSFLVRMVNAQVHPYSILSVMAQPLGDAYSSLTFSAFSGSQSDGSIQSVVETRPVFHLMPNLDDYEGAIAYRFSTRNPFTLGSVVSFGNSPNEVSINGKGEIKTAAPTGGTAQPFKVGSVIAATVQLVTDKYVQVEIGGQVVKLAVVE